MNGPINDELKSKVSEICDAIVAGTITQDEALLRLCNAGLNAEIQELQERVARLEAHGRTPGRTGIMHWLPFTLGIIAALVLAYWLSQVLYT